MKSSTHGILSVAFLVVLLVVSYYLDRSVFAGAERTQAMMDSSWAWTKIAARLTTSGLLVLCTVFVLHDSRPSRLVAVLYLLVGTFLTALELPSVVARLDFEPLIVSRVFGIALPITAAFLTAIGVAALLRPYVLLTNAKA